MATTDQADKARAAAVLSSYGYDVELLAERPGTPTADLRATSGSDVFFVEVKRKEDNPAESRQLAARLQAGEVTYRATPLTQRGRIRTILGDAEKQLDATARSMYEYRLAWLMLGGRDPSVYWQQAHNAFYGSVDVVDLDSGQFADCLYFDYAAAWTLPNIDGVLVSDASCISLWLNEFSPRYPAFSQTHLASEIRRGGGLFDPQEWVDGRERLALRSDLSRGNEKAVEGALHEQTRAHYEVVRPTAYVAEALVQNPKTEDHGHG